MDFIEFKLWKFGLIVLAAFLYGLFVGLPTERGEGERRDRPPE